MLFIKVKKEMVDSEEENLGFEDYEDYEEGSPDLLARDVAFRDLERIIIGPRQSMGTGRIITIRNSEDLISWIQERLNFLSNSETLDIPVSSIKTILSLLPSIPQPQYKNPKALLVSLVLSTMGRNKSIEQILKLLKYDKEVREVDVLRYMYLITIA